MLRRTILLIPLLGAPCATLASPGANMAAAGLAVPGEANGEFKAIAFDIKDAIPGLTSRDTPISAAPPPPHGVATVSADDPDKDGSPWQATAMIIASLMLVAFMARHD